MKNYQLIVFDWDGTLYDSAAHIVMCMQKTAKTLYDHVPPAEKLRSVIGLSFEKAMEVVFPNVQGDQITQFAKTFRDHIYSDDKSHTPKLFEGAKEVLNDLMKRGYWLAIATGKNRHGLDCELKALALETFFMTTRCANETQSKPHPQMLMEIMDELGVLPKKTLMIGDTIYDLELAANAHVDALAATYGVHAATDLMKYSIKGAISDIRELPRWMDEQH